MKSALRLRLRFFNIAVAGVFGAALMLPNWHQAAPSIFQVSGAGAEELSAMDAVTVADAAETVDLHHHVGVDGMAQQVAASGSATSCSGSPATTPFQRPLPILPVLSPSSTDATSDYYQLTMRQATASILPGLSTTIWGYNGVTPGPIIRAQSGRKVAVHQTNQLGENMSVHLHGGHTPSEFDGAPMALIAPGAARDYVYPNNQDAATHWYHDHAMDLTGPHVYKGLAAPYIVTDSAEQALNLPSGAYDVTLVLQDRTFNADGSLCYALDSSTQRSGFQGDTILVNGAVQPYFPVAQRKYRLRFLNGANASRFELALSTGDPLVQVASDGGLLAAPVSRSSAVIAPAEREEFVVDFSRYPLGTQIVLTNLQSWGARTGQIMRFDVASAATDTSALPATLRSIPKLDPSTAVATRVWTLGLNNETWVINGKAYDPNRIDASPKLGTTEIWEIDNWSGEYHPVHIHDMEWQVLDWDGVPPAAYDAGWKDTFLLKPGGKMRVIARFIDNLGTYMLHCHNLEHEDHAMMAQFQVVP